MNQSEMPLDQTQAPVVACTLGPDDLAAQASRWKRLRAEAECDRALTDDGIRLSFRDEPWVESELRGLAGAERACCSWARWDVDPCEGRVELHVRSSGDGVRTLHGMFG